MAHRPTASARDSFEEAIAAPGSGSARGLSPAPAPMDQPEAPRNLQSLKEKADLSALLAARVEQLQQTAACRGSKECAQRYRHLQAQQDGLLKGLRAQIKGLEDVARAYYAGELAEQARLPHEVWSEHIACRLGAGDVRGVSKAWRTTFDERNTTLALHPALHDRALALLASSPKLQVLHVPRRLKCKVEVLRAAAACSHLHTLHLGFCREREDLVALGPVLRPLKGLKALDISDNDLGPGVRFLASDLETLTGLESLDASCNNMSEYGVAYLAPALQALTQLHTLKLNANCICRGATRLAPVLQALTALTRLELSRNSLHLEAARALAPVLQRLAGLKVLDLSHNDLDAFAAVAALAPVLQALPGLQTLSLGSNGLLGEGVAELAPALKAMSGLLELDLSSTEMGPEGAAALAPVLLALTSLQKLNLSSNRVGAEGAAALAQALRRLLRLQALRLGDNSLGAAGAAALSPALQALSCLQTLSLCHNGLDAASATAAVAPVLKALGGLRELDLSGNALGMEGIASLELRALTALTLLGLERVCSVEEGQEAAEIASALCPVLKALPGLQDLCLSGNAFIEEDATALADALVVLTRLRALSLSDNSFGAAGIQMLAPALQALTGLSALQLGNVLIEDAHAPDDEAPPPQGVQLAQALEPVLGALKRLRVLDLGGNRLGTDGAAALLSGLYDHEGLQHLHLERTGLRAPGVLALVPAFKALEDLRTLEISTYDDGDNEDGGDSGMAWEAINACIGPATFIW